MRFRGLFFPFNSVYLHHNPLFQNKIYFVTTWKVWIRFWLALVVRNTPYIVLQYIFIISIFKPLYINLHVKSSQMKTIIIRKKAVDTISVCFVATCFRLWTRINSSLVQVCNSLLSWESFLCYNTYKNFARYVYCKYFPQSVAFFSHFS